MRNEAFKTQSFTRKQQTFYDKTAKGGNTSSSNTTTLINNVVLEITITAGEDIYQGCGYSINPADKKAYKATALSTDDKECTMIAAANALEGAEAKFYLTGLALVINANFTPGAPVYLRSGGTNVSSDILSAKTVDEDMIQQIGTAISVDQFIIEIDSPIFYE